MPLQPYYMTVLYETLINCAAYLDSNPKIVSKHVCTVVVSSSEQLIYGKLKDDFFLSEYTNTTHSVK